MRAKLYIGNAISARSRKPTIVDTSIAVEQRTRLVAEEHRRLAFLDDMCGPAHRRCRVLADDLPDNEPVEQPADRREVLLDRRRAVTFREQLDIGRDVVRADRAELGYAVHLQPVKESTHRDAIGGARVRVPDVRGEEIYEPERRALAGGGNHCRHRKASRRFDDGKCCGASRTAVRLFAVVHRKSPLFRSTTGRTGLLTDRSMHRVDAYLMVRRRTAEAGLKGKLGCHMCRATGITAYLERGGTLENAQKMAAHSSPRKTKLYDRRADAITLDEVERIGI